MREEIKNQIEDLPRFAAQLRRTNTSPDFDPSEIVFTGSGDSFASSLFAYYISGGQAHAADPYELQLDPKPTENKTIFITSVSGKTRANVELAKRVKRLAKERIAVTANPESPLARECDDIIQLNYRTRGTLTSGTVSFTASLLALASRVRRLPLLKGLAEIEARAAEWAQLRSTIPQEGFLFVGSGIRYALSAYGAFKVHEVLGLRADFEHSEQFGHSRLFSLGKRENVVCLATRKDGKTVNVFRALVRKGLHAHLLTTKVADPVVEGLEASFAFQHLALNVAKKTRLRECAFLSDSARLSMSNRLIY